MALVKVVSQFDPPQYTCIEMDISDVGSIYNLGGQIFNSSSHDLWFQTQTLNQLCNGNLIFPSISYYFYIPIIFDYLEFHCPTEAMKLGQFFFHENNLFSNMDLNSMKLSITSPYQTDMLSSTKIVA